MIKKGIDKKKGESRFVCEKCLKPIKVGERYSFIGTYDREKDNKNDKIISEFYYHISCWKDYFNECIIERLKVAQNNALGILKNNPMFQNLIGQMGVQND